MGPIPGNRTVGVAVHIAGTRWAYNSMRGSRRAEIVLEKRI